MRPWCAATCCLELQSGRLSISWLHLQLQMRNFTPWKSSTAVASAPSLRYLLIPATPSCTLPQTSIPFTPTSLKQLGATFNVPRSCPPPPTHLRLERSPDGSANYPILHPTLCKPDFTTLPPPIPRKNSTDNPSLCLRMTFLQANASLRRMQRNYGPIC